MINILIRTVIMYLFVMVMMRLTGKRQIGQLQIGELVVTFLISELASWPIQEPDAPIWHALASIAVLVLLEIGFSFLSLKSLRIRKWVEGRPSVLIENGRVRQKELKKNRFSMDDLMENLRQGGALSINEVETAILETNGRLSVFLKKSESPPAAADLNVPVTPQPIPYTVISDGRLLANNLDRIGISEKQMLRILRKHGYKDRNKIFYMSLTRNQAAVIIEKE
jgi:uncharacterized membrane protein YcaP (DUF421 family)